MDLRIPLIVHGYSAVFNNSFNGTQSLIKLLIFEITGLSLTWGMLNGLFHKKSKHGGLRTCNFHGYWGKNMWKFQGSIKKEVKFPGVIKKKSCGISIGLGFWPWNPQGVSHNFAESPGVENFFSAILEGKVQTSQMVLLPLSQSHGRFLISYSFTNFGPIFFKANSFLKTKHRQHIPMLLKNIFLV